MPFRLSHRSLEMVEEDGSLSAIKKEATGDNVNKSIWHAPPASKKWMGQKMGTFLQCSTFQVVFFFVYVWLNQVIKNRLSVIIVSLEAI